MRHPKDMTYAELVKIVERLQSLTYCDEIERGDPRCPDAIRVGEDAPEAGEWVEVWRPTRWLRGEGSEDFLKLVREAMEGAGLAPEAIAEVRAEEFYNETQKPRLTADDRVRLWEAIRMWAQARGWEYASEASMNAVVAVEHLVETLLVPLPPRVVRQAVPWQDVSTHMLDEGSGKILFGAETAEAVLALEAVFPKGRWIETDEQQRLLDPGLGEMDLVRRAPPTWMVWGEGPPQSALLASAPRTPAAAEQARQEGFDSSAGPERWAVTVEATRQEAKAWMNGDAAVRGWHKVPERDLGMASLALQPGSGLER